MTRGLYALVQCTWGFPQTLLGLLLFLRERRRPRSRYRGAVVVRWRSACSLSLGLFVFLSERESGASERRWLLHEYGHTVQSLLLGPAYLPVIGLPSLIWALWPPLVRRRRARGTPYAAFFPERWADRLGERVSGEKIR